MKRQFLLVVTSFALLTAQPAFSLAQGPAAKSENQSQLRSIEGPWEGVLDVGAAKLRLVVKISKEKDGSLAAKLDSPDQGAMDLPVSSMTLEGNQLRFEMKVIGGAYEGALNEDRSEAAGKWSQGGQSLPLVLKRIEKAPELPARPQEPKKPYPYEEQDVSYENKAGGVKLAGTLTLPRTAAPFPAVVLISGSGAQDRNEALLGHKPFLVLADHLTRKGIAVLRVDDRGVGGSTGNITASTSEDFAGDVLAGVEFLKARKEIDPRQIGLIGHSEGGLIAPMVASRSHDVAFIVLMAGPGLIGEEILYLQGALIAKASGAPEDVIAQSRANQEAIFAILKQEKDDAAAEMRIRESYVKMTAQLSEEQRKAAGGDTALEAQLKSLLSPWFRYFLTYDPKPALMKVQCPVLAVNGEKDLQVPVDQNLKAIDAALAAGKNKDFQVVKLPGLNHLFQTCVTGAPGEYVKIQETMAPSALELMADWILKRTKRH
jgi:hypothetical protein